MHRKHNATKNCDLSENNLKCGQTLNSGEKKTFEKYQSTL